jgi:hypothetical protein
MFKIIALNITITAAARLQTTLLKMNYTKSKRSPTRSAAIPRSANHATALADYTKLKALGFELQEEANFAGYPLFIFKRLPKGITQLTRESEPAALEDMFFNRYYKGNSLIFSTNKEEREDGKPFLNIVWEE